MHLIPKTCLTTFVFISLITYSLSAQNKGRPGNDEPSKKISLAEFNKRVDRAVFQLKTKKLLAISDSDHINIIKCWNTITFSRKSLYLGLHHRVAKQRFNGIRYKQLEILASYENYVVNLEKIYPETDWGRGGGIYFVKLRVAHAGSPTEDSMYDVLSH